MLYVLIVTANHEFAKAARRDVVRFSLVIGGSRCECVSPTGIRKILLTNDADKLHCFRKAEEVIANFLHGKDIIHDRFVGILQVDASCAGNIPFGSPQGELILAFPEIQWVPVYGQWRDESADNAGCMTWKRAVKLCRNGYSPLFDGDGLRSCLMLRVREHGTSYARADVALAVDEEANFAQMNAYTAYRFGYRAYSISSRGLADELLRISPSDLPKVATLMEKDIGHLKEFRSRLSTSATIVFEDVQLQFSDDTDGNVQPFGNRRDEKYCLLREADLRVVATASRREEKIADEGGPDKATVGDHFRKKRKQVGRRLWRERERLLRWWFNASGAWVGHWLVNTMDAVLMTGVLLGVFFVKVSLLLPVLFGLFLLRGMLQYGFRVASVRGKWLPEGVRRYCVRRWQWRFLPKRYRNHCPENRVCGKKGKFWTVTHKPLAGIFGLRNECCLPNGRGFQGLYDSETVRHQYQCAIRGAFARCDEENISHAAPGMALEIAVRLLRRAERLVVEDKIIDAEGAIHGAVLATVAGELLDAKTPAVSIEALTWKQYFEIRAECEFVGVRAHTDMVDRYIDIHNAMGRICRSSNGLVREDVFTSGMAELMDKLSDLLSEKGKREEAQYFAKKARMFHRRLMNPVVRNLLAYPEWLLRSAWHVVASFAMIALVFFVYWMFRIDPGCSAYNAFSRTYEVLVCDEPDLAWPGREEASWVVVNGPFPAKPDQGTPNIWEVQPTTEPKHIQEARKAAAAKKGKNGQKTGHPSRKGIPKETFSILVHTMRQIALLHLAFLGLCFWDAMRQK